MTDWLIVLCVFVAALTLAAFVEEVTR